MRMYPAWGRRQRIGVILALACILGTLSLAQYRGRVWARYEPEMQDPVEDPPDTGRKGEFALGRLRYRSPNDYVAPYTRWGIDVNKCDRIFIGVIRRITRIDTEPIEDIVDVSDDHIYDLPWLLAGSVGDWKFSPSEAQRLRNYFDRGGFLMVDDFHNEREWGNFMAGMHKDFTVK